ncbi:MAG: HD domain-containing protein, partial [Alphaproteobacteria bacterium]|nr:HD domain-containing protein [Alphaproteobacteria bacterium]
RTGQAGLVPETKVVMEYAINDYKEKVELTSKKLITTVVSAIRAYENIRALKDSKSQIESLNYDLKKLVDSLDRNVITAKVDNEGSLKCVSRAFCETMEYEENELLGRKTIEFLHPNYDKEQYKAIEEAYSNYSEWEGEVQVLTKGKKTLWAHVKREMEYNENGEFLNYILILQDITAQKDMQEAKNEIEALNEEITSTQKEIIFRLGEITETRSKETGMHVKRVAEYSKLLALYYGLSKDEAEIIKMASPMHDIGKVAIPDNILNKPGKYTPEEFEIMKTHAQIGYEMLKSSKKTILKAAAIIAHQHQEK